MQIATQKKIEDTDERRAFSSNSRGAPNGDEAGALARAAAALAQHGSADIGGIREVGRRDQSVRSNRRAWLRNNHRSFQRKLRVHQP